MVQGYCPRASCGLHKRLTRHHVLPQCYFGRKRNRIIVWLCWECHAEYHRLTTRDRMPKAYYFLSLCEFLETQEGTTMTMHKVLVCTYHQGVYGCTDVNNVNLCYGCPDGEHGKPMCEPKRMFLEQHQQRNSDPNTQVNWIMGSCQKCKKTKWGHHHR